MALQGAAQDFFHSLIKQQTAIEKKLGEKFYCHEEIQGEKQIYLALKYCDVTDRTDWSDQHQWLAMKFEKLVEVFRPRILELRANEAESFIEEQAEYVTSQSESNMPMHAYVVMLHLVSQGYSDFTEIREVLCRESAGSYYITILEHIVRKIEVLEEEWDESIPPITALVFNTDGYASKWTCEVLTGDGDVQPTAKQVAKLMASVAAYDKWDKVLKALKP